MNAKIIVDVPAKQVNKPFTYIIPESMQSVIEIGDRVIVPFNQRRLLGFVVEIVNSNETELKEIEQLLDLVPVLNKEMIDLAYEIAKKTSAFLISVLKTMIPSSLSIKYKKTLKKINEIKIEEIKKYFDKDEIDYDKISAKDLSLLKLEIKEKNIEVVYQTLTKDSIKNDTYVSLLKYNFLKSDKQQAILDYLLEKKEDVLKKDIIDKYSESSLSTLEKNGLVKIYKKEVYREISNPIETEHKDIFLNDEQKRAYEEIDLFSSKTYLLYGVTGSGKTEVYLNIINDVIARGKKAIFLVPEISLTPQMASRVKARFEKVALFHSGMSANEKYDEWRKIYRDEVDVVVGARSAIFAPIKNIGVIIIDEEHEQSYKQDSQPRYHARDVALLRSKYHNCPLILGSATPLVSSYYKALNKEYKLLTLYNRANNSKLPNMHIINMSRELNYGNKSMFSNTLHNLISDRLEKHEQTILLLNKRGYSSFVMCRNCGEAVKCPNCDVSLTYHKTSESLVCHYCGYRTNVPTTCPKCQSTLIKPVGVGTEQVEEQVKRRFNCNVLRMDSDTTSKKGSHAEIIKDFIDGKADILVGTQMISKGLDFKNVTLVGVLMADITLNLPDYRNSERTFELITQVSGRAGRHNKNSDVVVQSYNTDHYSIDSTKYNNYEVFYKKEIEKREMAKYPPFSNLSQIVIEHKDMKEAFNIGKKIVQRIKEIMPLALIMGPAVASIARVKNNFRVQITVKNKTSNEDLFKIIEGNQDINIYIDHDPVLI